MWGSLRLFPITAVEKTQNSAVSGCQLGDKITITIEVVYCESGMATL